MKGSPADRAREGLRCGEPDTRLVRHQPGRGEL